MAKAKFIGKWLSRDFNNEYVNLEYEYRGHMSFDESLDYLSSFYEE